MNGSMGDLPFSPNGLAGLVVEREMGAKRLAGGTFSLSASS